MNQNKPKPSLTYPKFYLVRMGITQVANDGTVLRKGQFRKVQCDGAGGIYWLYPRNHDTEGGLTLIFPSEVTIIKELT